MDQRGFKEAFLPLADQLYRIAYSILESEADAKDAVQDLFVKLWEDRDTLDAVYNPKAYCITRLRNLCIDRIRKAHKAHGETLNEEIASADTSTSEAIDDKRRLRIILQHIEALPPAQKEVLTLKVFEDLSYEEIAERTGLSYLTMRVLLSQARRKLKSLI